MRVCLHVVYVSERVRVLCVCYVYACVCVCGACLVCVFVCVERMGFSASMATVEMTFITDSLPSERPHA